MFSQLVKQVAFDVFFRYNPFSWDNRPYLKLLISSCSLSCVVPPCIQVQQHDAWSVIFSMLNCCISVVRSLKPFTRDPEVTNILSRHWSHPLGTLKTKAFIPFSVASILSLYHLSCWTTLWAASKKCIRIHWSKALPSSFINCNTFEINERALSESNRSRSPKYRTEYTVRIFPYWFSRFIYSRPLLSWKRGVMFKNCVRPDISGYNSSGGTEIMLFVNDLSVYNQEMCSNILLDFQDFLS